MPTKIEKDAYSGMETTGHEWDGIKELNRPLPKWWLYVLWATVIWSIGFYFFYPAWPYGSSYTKGFLGWSQRQQVQDEITTAKAGQAQFLDAIAAKSVVEIQQDDTLRSFALAGGAAAFKDNCAPCHGSSAIGGVGYPSLADDDWLWGGTLESIHATLLHGIRYTQNEETRQSEMPRFGVDELLEAEQIASVAEYVMSLSGRSEDGATAERGKEIFAEQCVACHGENGEGNAELGAPKLSDQVWLYGDTREDIVHSITYSRVSP